MRASLVLCVAAALVSAARAECDVCLAGGCYRSDRLLTSDTVSWIMDIYRNTSTIYASDGDTVRQCQLNSEWCNTTPLSRHLKVQWMTVDQSTGDIYVLTDDDSIFKLDLARNEENLLVRDVKYLTFKDKLYYSSYNDGIYTFEDGESRVVAGTKEYDVESFVVDKKGDIYFFTELNDNYTIRRLSNGVVDGIHWEGKYLITLDRDANAVFINKQSNIVYRATDGQLTEIGFIDEWIHSYYTYDAPLFDGDNNIIYMNTIYVYNYLKRDINVSCTYSISGNTVNITETVVSTQEYGEHDFMSSTPTYNIGTTTNSTPTGNTDDSVNMPSSTLGPESAAGTPDESGASSAGTPGQEA